MKFSLVIPGLLNRRFLSEMEARDLPALNLILSRSHRSALPVTGFHASLFYLFGIEPAPGRSLPLAAVTRYADAGACNDAIWMRADPVHLRADQSRLVLFDAPVLLVTAAEATQLVRTFNDHFSARGWQLEATRPDRWYLRMDEAPRFVTTPLASVAGRDIDPCLPTGEGAREWHAVLNEIQMLFHEHPVNHARSDAGQPAINSIWCWGEGACPRPVPGDWTRVASAEPVAAGLASLAGVAGTGTIQTASGIRAGRRDAGHEMIVLDNLVTSTLYGDTEAWLKIMTELERDWFAPLCNAIRRGVIRQLTLYPCDGQRFRTTHAGLRRFWKPVRALGAFAIHD